MIEHSPSAEDAYFAGLDNDLDAMRSLITDLGQILLESITQREHQVLNLRYGLYGVPEHTQTEAGRRLGISQQRINRLESSAIRKLRTALTHENTHPVPVSL